jgi:hypothetical protein
VKSTQELVHKYQITKQGLLKRVEFLELQPETGSRGAFFFTSHHEQMLDELHKHLASKKAMESFIALSKSEIVPINGHVDDNTYTQVDRVDSKIPENFRIEPSFLLDRIPDAIALEIDAYFGNNSRLKYYPILELCAKKGWGLTKEEIKSLTGITVRSITYQYDCFLFIRYGKVKRQATWRVKKQ